MLDVYKRWIQFHELKITSEPEEAEYIPLKNIMPFLRKRIKDKESVKLLNKETAALRIAKSKYYKKDNIVILLLQYSDTKVTDPAFQNLKRGKIRTEEKLDGEGIAVSAHVAISLEAHDDIGICYKFLLEEIPGLGRSRLSPFIKSELKIVSKGHFTYKDNAENKKIKNILPSSEVLGTPTKGLKEELAEGVILQHIDLIQLKPKKEFDEEGFYKVVEKQLKIIPANTVGVKIADKIKKALKIGREKGYDEIKIRYKKLGDKQKTAVLGTTLSDITDSLVVRTEEVKSDKELGQCMVKISGSISKQMRNFILEERKLKKNVKGS